LLTALLSITALFTVLMIAYVARSRTRIFWQPIVLPAALWVSTVVIAFSSGSLELARRGFRRMEAGAYSAWLKVTAGLGVAFVLSQALAFQRLAAQGVFMRQNPRSALFYIVTGTHGLHLIGGLGALGYLIWLTSQLPSLRAGYQSHKNVLAVGTVYWHFLVVLWLALFWILVSWK
jgi:cytochrome c oxidase subunit 3